MNLLCFLKHLLERRIARRREARRSDRLQRATPPRQRPEPTGTIADPCQPSVSRSTWKRAMQVVRLWHNTRPQPRGSTVSQHPSFYATPSGGRRSRRHQRAATTHRTGKITRTKSILGGGGRRCSRARILGRRAVLERRRVIGRRRREHVGHLRRPQRERRTSRRADHSQRWDRGVRRLLSNGLHKAL